MAAAAHGTSCTPISAASGSRRSAEAAVTATSATSSCRVHARSVARRTSGWPRRSSAASRAAASCTDWPGDEQDQEGGDERGQRAVVGLAEQAREDDREDELDRVVAQRGGGEPRRLAGVRARERRAQPGAPGRHRAVHDRQRALRRGVPCVAAGALEGGLAERRAPLGPCDEVAYAGHELGGLVGQQAGLAVDDRLAQAADAHRSRRRAAGGGLEHGQAPALGRRGGQRHPRPREQPRLLRLVDVAVEGHAVAPARGAATSASSAARWSPSPARSRCASGIASRTSSSSSMRLYCFRRPR